jgi:predicted acylesterase/phospholipase RssA
MATTVRLICLAAVCILATACTAEITHTPLSPQQFRNVDLRAIYPYRIWGDEVPDNIEELMASRVDVIKKRYAVRRKAGNTGLPVDRLLAISGGGANGAFGAGLLAGWTETGKRPEFDVVTGVSTGAIIAPFAFLGPEYDPTLLEIYRTGSKEKVFQPNPLLKVVFGSAALDTTPLKKQIDQHFSSGLIEAIAQEHRRGRNLFIITTHLDAHRPIIWDIGAMATVGGNRNVEMIRRVILASASIPGLFPPVPIEFEHKGQVFTELHVDGGVSHNVFAYSPQIPIARLDELLGFKIQREIYVIVNGNLRIAYSPAPTGTLSISARAVRTLLQNQLNADLERIYFLAERDDIAFQMIAIPQFFTADGSAGFDRTYMQNLLGLGQAIGRKELFWVDKPPSLQNGN